MESEENGTRKEMLKRTMEAITSIYDLANPNGILSVQFFNSDIGFKNITQKNLPWLWERCSYGGVTRIGSALGEKILNRFVVPEMKKPLLVMIVTDGAVSSFSPLSFFLCLTLRHK